MTKSDYLIYEETRGDYKIKCTQRILLPKITEFVSKIYHRKFGFTISYSDLFEKLLKEDDLFKNNSVVCTVYDSQNEILATIRLIRASNEISLPIEREFNIDVAATAREMAPKGVIWEVARLAATGNNTFELLINEGIRICKKDDLCLMCIDSQVLYLVKRMGITLRVLGEPKRYLGSMTYPAAVSVRDFIREFSGASYNEISSPLK